MNGRHWVIGEAARLVIKVIIAAVLLVLLAYACSAQELTAQIARQDLERRVVQGTSAIAFFVAYGLFSIGLWLEVTTRRGGRTDRWQ